MTENFASLFLALGIFAVGFISIGPNIPAIIGTSMANKAPPSRGAGTGSGIWATLTVTPPLATAYAEAMIVLKLFGLPPLAGL